MVGAILADSAVGGSARDWTLKTLSKRASVVSQRFSEEDELLKLEICSLIG